MSIATDPGNLPPPGSLVRRSGTVPAGPGRPAKVWAQRLAKARANPGVWTRLDGDFSVSVAGALRAGRYAGTKKGELETRRRSLGNGRFEVWVRVVTGDAAPVELEDWGELNHDGVPVRYVDVIEDMPDGSIRYHGPLMSEGGKYIGDGAHESPEAYVATLRALRAANQLPY